MRLLSWFQRMEALLAYLRARARLISEIERMILFGSRARGEHGARSDYDIAVVAPGVDAAAWSRWALETREGVPTLCGLDLILLDDSVSEPLREKIRREGKIIYERNPTGK